MKRVKFWTVFPRMPAARLMFYSARILFRWICRDARGIRRKSWNHASLSRPDSVLLIGVWRINPAAAAAWIARPVLTVRGWVTQRRAAA